MDVNNESAQKKPCLHANETGGLFNHQLTVYVGTVYFMETWTAVELRSLAENYIKTKQIKRYFGDDC